MKSKVCSDCCIKKSINDFYYDNQNNTYYSMCKQCKNERRRNNRLKRNYGITPEKYAEMLKEQNGCCYICGYRPKGYRLHVDHNHNTKEVRALLCFQCNYRLGAFERDYERFSNYLRDRDSAYR